MGSTRSFRRAAYRRAGKEWPAIERPYRDVKRGAGYEVLHPRKGWRRVSAKRLRAQALLAAMRDKIDRRMSRL